LFYKNIAQFAKNQLNPHGKLYFEVHYNFGKNLVELLQSFDFQNITLKKDIAGNNRMIRAEI
jgi:release factor glutamine methyltransferase